MQLAGKGNDANVLQGDIAACGGPSGPSYVHTVRSVLLPFVPSMTGRTNAAGTAYSTSTPAPAPALAAGAAPAPAAALGTTPLPDAVLPAAGGRRM